MARVKVTNPIPCFTEQQLESLCKIMADTNTGLTGSEIARVLAVMGIQDVDPHLTKWKRLFNALAVEQNNCNYGNHVISFINRVYDPVLWASNEELFNSKRNELNTVLAFCGLTLREDGKVAKTTKVNTLSEAELRADKLKTVLQGRQVHPVVLTFCRAELLTDNYFHAVLEATKSIGSRLRKMSGLDTDGASLVTSALSLGKYSDPIISINSLSNETERSEQNGFMNLIIGLFGTFRNPSAHAARIEWDMPELDALDILSIVSLVHRKLDNSKILNANRRNIAT